MHTGLFRARVPRVHPMSSPPREEREEDAVIVESVGSMPAGEETELALPSRPSETPLPRLHGDAEATAGPLGSRGTLAAGGELTVVVSEVLLDGAGSLSRLALQLGPSGLTEANGTTLGSFETRGSCETLGGARRSCESLGSAVTLVLGSCETLPEGGEFRVPVAEDAEDVDVDVAALHAEARRHQIRSACTHLNKETGEYDFESIWTLKPRYMGHLGAGVQLYFQFLKQMGYVFLLLFTLSVPSLVLNACGNMVEEANPLQQFFSRLSVANLGRCAAAGCQSFAETRGRCAITFPRFGLANVDPDHCDLTVSYIAEFLGTLDAVGMVIFIFFGIYFVHIWIPRTVQRTDDANVTPADYTIWVPALPDWLQDPDEHAAYSDRLKQHFQNVLATSRNPVNDPDSVKDVTLVHGFDGAIMKFNAKGKLLQDQDNVRVLHRLALKANKPKLVASYAKKIASLDKQIMRIEMSLKDQAKITDSERRVCSAFVTFSHEEYKDVVLGEYRFAHYRLFRLCQQARLRFGGQRIDVIEACEPTDLYWQNLDFSPRRRMVRKGIVLILTLLVLILCSAVVASLEGFKGQSAPDLAHSTWILAATPKSGSPCLDLCSWDLFSSPECSSVEGSNSGAWPVARLFNSSGNIGEVRLDGTCRSSLRVCDVPGGSGAWVGIEFKRDQTVACMKVSQEKAHAAKELRPFACKDEVVPQNTTGLASFNPIQHCQAMELVYPDSATSSGGLTIALDTACAAEPAEYIDIAVARQAKEAAAGSPLRDKTYTCFCRQQSRKNLAGFISPPYDNPQEELCSEWSLDMTLTYMEVGGSVLAITVLNQFLLIMYRYFIDWERLCTVTDVARSQLWKLFLAQFVNTGLLMLLINANIKDYPAVLSFIQALSIGKGHYNDIGGQWFTVVGTSLVVTIIVGVCLSVLTPLFMTHVVQPLTRCFLCRGKMTQEAVNEVYALPEWNLSLRMAETMNIVFCVVMYSGGMPILYLVGFLYCAMAYWADKWVLLRGSCRPPQYTEDVVRMGAMLMPLAALLHTAVTGWVFGSQLLFPSEWSMFKPFMERVLSMDESEYTDITEAYRMGLMDGVTVILLKARFMDFARKGAWTVLVIFLAVCAYYVVYYLWTMLLKPFLSPFAFLIQEVLYHSARTCGRCCGCSLFRNSKGMSMSWDDAVVDMRSKGITSSYRLADNVNYHAASKALHHTTELVKSHTNGSVLTNSPNKRWRSPSRRAGSSRKSSPYGSPKTGAGSPGASPGTVGDSPALRGSAEHAVAISLGLQAAALKVEQ